jgi:hypothetical protein
MDKNLINALIIIGYNEGVCTGCLGKRKTGRTHNPLVPGSSPGGPTNKYKAYRSCKLFLFLL